MIQTKPFNAYIYYSRKDGEVYAHELLGKLKQDERGRKLRLWKVRRGNISESAVDSFENEDPDNWPLTTLPNALSQIESLIIIVSPAFLRSGYAQRAWEYANQVNLPCYLVNGGLEKAIYRNYWPFSAEGVFLYALEINYELLLEKLHGNSHLVQHVFMAPGMQSRYVHRPKLYESVKKQILSSKGVREARPIALSGADGYGKTTLATALCHDEEVQKCFPDGILWVTVREEDHASAPLVELLSVLTGEATSLSWFKWGSSSLAEILENGEYLLVVDNVKRYHQVAPFLKNISHAITFPNHDINTVRLITTSCENVVYNTNAVAFAVAGMEHKEAHQVLKGDSEANLAGQKSEKQLIDLTYAHPLLLHLLHSAATTVRDQSSFYYDSFSYITSQQGRPAYSAAELYGKETVDSVVGQIIENSLRLLPPEQRALCLALGTLFTPHLIPLQVLCSLWSLSEFETEQQVKRLADLALLSYGRGAVTIHPVIHNYYQHTVGEDAYLYHQRLATAWTDPYNLPDRYGWQFYVAHLLQAGKGSKAQQLLTDYRWLQAKLNSTDIHAVLEDFQRFPEKTQTADLLYKALLLSTPVLNVEKSNLGIQIHQRLRHRHADLPESFLKAVEESIAGSICKPIDTPYFLTGSLISSFPQDSSITVILPWNDCVVVGLYSGVINVMKKVSGKVLHTFVNYEGPIRCMVIEGDVLACGGSSWLEESGYLKTFDLASGKLVHTFSENTSAISFLAVAGDTLISGSYTGEKPLRSWNLYTGELKHVFEEHTVGVSCLAVSGDILICGGMDKSLRSWNLSTCKARHEFTGQSEVIGSLSVAEKMVVGASWDGTLRSWDLLTGQSLFVYKGHSREITCLAIEKDIIVSCGWDRQCILWDLYKGSKLNGFFSHYTKTILVTNRTLFTGSSEGLKCHELSTGEMRYEYDGSYIEDFGSVNCLALIDDVLVSGYGAGYDSIGFWELHPTVEQPKHYSYNYEYNAELYLYLNKIGFSFKGLQENAPPIVTLFLFGEALISGSQDGKVLSWDLSTGMLVNTFTGHTSSISCLYKKGDILLSGSGQFGSHTLEIEGRDTTVRSWRFSTGEPLFVFGGHTRRITCLGISGETAVSGSEDATLRSWDLLTGATIQVFTGHESYVTSLVANGNLLISSGKDYTVRYWDLKSGKCIGCIFTDEYIIELTLNNEERLLTGKGSKGGQYTFLLNKPLELLLSS